TLVPAGDILPRRALLRREGADVFQKLGDVRVAEVVAERGHAGTADGGAAVLDDVEEVAVGFGRDARRGEAARAEQEQGGAPRPAAIAAMALHAVRVVEAFPPAGPRRGLGVGEKPGEASRE